MFPKFTKIYKLLFKKNRKIGKCIFFSLSRRLRRFGIFFPAPAAPLFFSNRKMKIIREQSLFKFGKGRWFAPPPRNVNHLIIFLFPIETRKFLCCYRENRLFLANIFAFFFAPTLFSRFTFENENK